MKAVEDRTSLASQALQTPCLVLDRDRMDRNIQRMHAHLRSLNLPLRAHLKTCKSVDVARRLMSTPQGPAAVSTLREAEVFAEAGVRDILYAVGISASKLSRVEALRKRGVDLAVVLDSIEQAQAVVAVCRAGKQRIPVLIEVDPDGHRAGVKPGDAGLLDIGRCLHDGGAELRGVMSHAGSTYDTPGVQSILKTTAAEHVAALRCAQDLRNAGLPCPVVSVGSTPAASLTGSMPGVTEIRAGVFVFHDLVMAGLGVCAIDDIALSVLASVIGHRADKAWILVDAGWSSLSLDRGTAKQAVDQGYGLVCDINGVPYPDLIVIQVNQEHGIVSTRAGSNARLPTLPVGSRVRILPNHACATASQHAAYEVIADGAIDVAARWPRFAGW